MPVVVAYVLLKLDIQILTYYVPDINVKLKAVGLLDYLPVNNVTA